MQSFFRRRASRGGEGGSAILGFIAAAGCQLAQAAPPTIPFTRERLPNGLTVIFHEDHRLPLVTVNLWYYVGSKDEVQGRSGFAHLFEHLMFMGTERVPNGQFDVLIEGAGGSDNASTSADRTNYFDEGPANLLPSLLYLEADRMEGFGRSIDQEKLDTQRRVVQNERRQSYENRPYGKAMLEKWKLLYPPGHPYHEPVIGSHRDLESASVKDVQDFFARFYVPSNASLVVAGDFDLAETKALVERFFAKIPAGRGVSRPEPIPVALEGEKRATIPDRVQLDRVAFSYHSPAVFKEGDADLDIAGAILGDGKSSRLYRALVYDRKIAQNVAAAQGSQLLGSLFEVQATARPGQDLDELERAMDQEIRKLCDELPTQAEVERARNGFEVEFWRRIESLNGRADLLNSYQFQWNDPDGIARDLGRYAAVTPESVRKWARSVLRPDARLVLRVVGESSPSARSKDDKKSEPPAQGEPAAAPGTPPVPPGPEAPPQTGSAEKTSSDILPPHPPQPGPLKPFDPPVPEVASLKNGVRLWVLPSKQIPLVSLVLQVRGAGAASDPAGKYGLASLTASMLDEGAGSRGAIELAEELDKLGATLTSSASREQGGLRLNVLRKNLDAGLDLFADVLLRPRFDSREWERVKTLTVNELVQRKDNPTAVARVVLDRNFFGDGHPYAAPLSGYAATAQTIELEDLRNFYRERWLSGGAVLAAAGDISPEELRQKLEARLEGWKPGAVPDRAPVAPPATQRPRLVVAEKPGAPQTVISIAMPGRARRDPIYPSLLVANTIFGGSFTSRLNQNLREKNEFTYGAGSNFQRLSGAGAFLIQTSVKTDVTGEALAEIARECLGMGKGLVPGELSKARAAAKIQVAETFSTQAGTAEELAEYLDLGLSPDEPKEMLKRVEALKEADVEKTAGEVIRWPEATIVLVGDRAALEAEIAQANALLEKLSPAAAGLPKPVAVGPDGK